MKSKSTFTVVLFYAMAGMLMIAIHQNMRNGFAAAYMFYMLTFMLFLGFTYRRINESKDEEGSENNKKSSFKDKVNKKGK
jgi:Na+/melibiose symporter-like transporter